MINRIIEENLRSDKDRLLDYAWAHSQLGMYEEAVIDCENLIALDEGDPISHRELGIAYQEHNQIDEAIKCYQFAINRFPDYHALYTNLGHLFQEHKKRFDIAIVCYEKALELNPEDYWALHNIGVVLKKEYKIKEAFYYFQKSHIIAESKGTIERKIIHNLAWASYRCKKFKKALYLYAWLAEQYGDDSSIHFEFGCVNYRVGRYNEAMPQFDKALSIQQGNRFYRHARKAAFCKAWALSARNGR